jgi:DNA repair photolyase
MPVELITCRSALNRVDRMPFRWSLNPYRGCAHKCRYCYARRSHAFFDLDLGRDFEEVIFAKLNIAEVLRAELRRPSWRHETIVIGTATDPYQPLEGRLRLTRHCLAVLADAANPCSVTTKGTLVVRDRDIMQQLARETRFMVHISLITLDRDLWRRVEPGTPPPASRLRALERLRAAGIPAGIFLAPILPGLTDSRAAIQAVVQAAADHGAVAVWPGVLRLAPGLREWFIQFLRQEFPHLAASYERGYRGRADPPPAYREQVLQRVGTAIALTGLDYRSPPADPRPARVGWQYALPLDTVARGTSRA